MSGAKASQTLDFDQVKQLLRLLAEAREYAANSNGRMQHLIAGMRRIVGAAVGGCVIDTDFGPGRRGRFKPVVLDGWDSTTLPSLHVLEHQGSSFNPKVRALMELNQDSVTATRQELVSERDWYGSPFVEHYIAPAHLDHLVLSARRRPTPGEVHGVGFFRAKNDRPFSEKERNLVRLFHLECEHLLCLPDEESPIPFGRLLPPRQRQTLELLLLGLTDKEIADRLGISRYTVNQYTKAIYRHFGVSSRSLLMSHLLQSAGTSAVKGRLLP